jgi:predicted phosphodiesterase
VGRDIPIAHESVAVVSDIHGDEPALRQVLQRIQDLEVRGGLIVCGDLLFTYRPELDPLAALDLLLQQNIRAAVAGNTDRWFIDRTPTHERMLSVRSRLTPAQRRFLAALPRRCDLELGGRTIHITHASPLSDEQGLTLDLSEPELQERLAGVRSGYLVTGHLHRAFTRTVGSLTHFAVGAVSRHPHDAPAGPEFALLSPTASGFLFVPQHLAPPSRPAAGRDG